MIGNKQKKSDYKQSRRVYLFLLMTSVTFLAALFVFPKSELEKKQVIVRVQLKRVDQPEAAKKFLVTTIKNELSIERLKRTIESISASTNLESELLGHPDIEQVRNNLMAGALKVDATNEAGDHQSDNSVNGSLGFKISLLCSGTSDEVRFVEAMAENIRSALEPSSLNERALARLGEVQSKIRESNSLSNEGQKAVENSIEKFVAKQQKLFTSTEKVKPATYAPASNWELKNLKEQRHLAFKEYQANQSLDFKEKEAVQKSLLRRIEYLDQEIDGLERDSNQKRQLAKQPRGVEQASFVDDSATDHSGADSSEVQDLKANLALAINKLVLAQNTQKQTLRTARELSVMLQENRMQVHVSDTKLDSVNRSGSSRIWILLAASATLCGIIVMRIDSRAFATMLHDEQSVESALQLPVIGQVNLPESSDGSGKSYRKINQWVQRVVKISEVTLLLALLLFLAVLWINSDFSIAWLNNPADVLKNSFS